jgi:hypothetical protein
MFAAFGAGGPAGVVYELGGFEMTKGKIMGVQKLLFTQD